MNNRIFSASEPKGIKSSYAINGQEADVKYLIYHRHNPKEGEIIVFVDSALDLDWECDDKAGELIDQAPLKGAVRKIVNGVAALEPIAHNWPKDLKLTSKRLMGEALASVLRGDIEGAEEALENATKYVRSKSKQVSRYWTLQGCMLLGGAAAIAILIEIANREWVRKTFGLTPYLLFACFCAGCVGALLFVVLRFRSHYKVDSTAERHLHYLESVARIAGGGIAGVLVGSMVKLGLVLPIFGQGGSEALAMCAAAMIAGASERLAAGIVTKTENNETTKSEEANGDH